MTTEQFVYWLSGKSSMIVAQPTPDQWREIKGYLDEVARLPTTGGGAACYEVPTDLFGRPQNNSY
jgi:hypothetical protein